MGSKDARKPEIIFEIRLPDINTEDDSRSSYNGIYDQEVTIAQTESFYRWIFSLLPIKPNDHHLDLSCGQGQIVDLCNKFGAKSIGLDLSQSAVTTGGRQGVSGLMVGNSQILPFADNSFDVVSNIGSLEHYFDMDAAVSEMTRVLKPGGHAVVLLPNSFSILHTMLVAKNTGRTSVDNQPLQRYMARYEWQDLLEQDGLEIIDTHKYEQETPVTADDWKLYLRKPKKLLRLALKPFVPLNLALCFVYICRKPA